MQIINDMISRARHFRVPPVLLYGLEVATPNGDIATREEQDMATRQILVDDLTGTDDDVQSVSFTISGMTYTLDLGVASRTRLAELLQPFIDHARANKAVRTSRKRAASPGRHNEVAELRNWARENGYDIGDRGRIPANIREAYANR